MQTYILFSPNANDAELAAPVIKRHRTQHAQAAGTDSPEFTRQGEQAGSAQEAEWPLPRQTSLQSVAAADPQTTDARRAQAAQTAIPADALADNTHQSVAVPLALPQAQQALPNNQAAVPDNNTVRWEPLIVRVMLCAVPSSMLLH